MVELTEIIIKTRNLLTLRGFEVSELLEYENRWVMFPTREVNDMIVKKIVWIYKEPKVIGVAVVREINRAQEENECQEGMMVGGSRFTPAAKKLARKTRVELVEGGYASFELFGHEIVPKHVIATDEEVEMVTEHYGIKKTQLPRIARMDPAARVLGAKVGQVVRIERDSPTSGRTYYYRLVMEPGR